MSASITLTQLREAGACRVALELFAKLFGQSVEVSAETAEAHADHFDFDWAARNLLTAPALVEYERVTAPAWAEYKRARDLAVAELGANPPVVSVRLILGANLKRVRAETWAEYKRARELAVAELGRVTSTAWDEYQRALARAFAELYMRENGSKT